MVPQRFEDHADVHEVLLARFGEDEDVVAVDLYEAPQHGRGLRTGTHPRGAARPAGRVEGERWTTKDAVHVTHQDRGHAVQAESADAKLVLATGDAKRRLELVGLPNAELHVRHGKIELGEEARTARLIDELVDVRQRLHRPLRDGVQSAVVLTKAPRAILLSREHDRGRV